jgi:hypothetical protein
MEAAKELGRGEGVAPLAFLLVLSLARLCIAPAHVSLWLKNQPKFQQTTTKKGSVNSSH